MDNSKSAESIAIAVTPNSVQEVRSSRVESQIIVSEEILFRSREYSWPMIGEIRFNTDDGRTLGRVFDIVITKVELSSGYTYWTMSLTRQSYGYQAIDNEQVHNAIPMTLEFTDEDGGTIQEFHGRYYIWCYDSTPERGTLTGDLREGTYDLTAGYRLSFGGSSWTVC